MKTISIPVPVKRSSCAALTLVMAALFALIFMGSNSPLGPAIGSDNAIYLTMGTALDNGYAPYTEVFDHKGPVLFILETIPQMMSGGYSTLAVFIMETLFLWGCLLLIGTIARRFDVIALPAQVVFLLLLAPAIDGGNYCEEYTNLFNLLGVLLLMHIFDRDALPERAGEYALPAVGFGAVFMLSFLTRANNMLPLFGMLAVSTLYLLVLRRFSAVISCALGFLAGGAAIALPIGFWLYAQGALQEAIYASFIHNMMYAETDGASRMAMLLSDPYGWQAIAMALLACVGGAAHALRTKRPVVLLLLVFGAAGAGMAAFISHKFYSHYLMISAPLAAVGTAMLCSALKEKRLRLPMAAVAAVMAACGIALVLLGVRENGERAQQHAVFEELQAQTKELLAHVPEEERDALLGYRTEPKWYVAADAMPYLRFYFLQEILAQADPMVMDEIVAQLEADPPKWLVIYYNREFGPPYDERVQDIFTARYAFVDAKGQYQLLRLKDE